ncbi:hypothetical protein P3TCK_01494 [Photobacterium profundum 3TCK]|uniref:Uncharacterized protein n=1 Tax=Photobacterium profundum 3TCK TaxID=314280 RepID=Q1Z4Y2_9GAMM|nr:hypothetical protein P3TCK_01494 [Photobacterium profundum 3TCK]
MDFSTFESASQALSLSIYFLVGAAAAIAFVQGFKSN